MVAWLTFFKNFFRVETLETCEDACVVRGEVEAQLALCTVGEIETLLTVGWASGTF